MCAHILMADCMCAHILMADCMCAPIFPNYLKISGAQNVERVEKSYI